MAVPKKRKSHSRARTQRNHDAIKGHNPDTCAQCQEPMRRHHVCASCGYYRNKPRLEVESH
jgi:large subunit ribosomal protein L32